MHETKQSPYNYVVDQSKLKWIVNGYHNVIFMGKQEVTKRLKKSKFNCLEDNSNKQTECLNEYYASKLNCVLPWVPSNNPNNTQNRQKCQGKEKFNEFRNLSMSIGNPEVIGELEKKGCIIPNCEERTWHIRSGQKENISNSMPNISGQNLLLTIDFPHSSKVLVRNEINLYTVSSFFADVGGYFGLLLGESLISYFLLIIQWLKKIISSGKFRAAK